LVITSSHAPSTTMLYPLSLHDALPISFIPITSNPNHRTCFLKKGIKTMNSSYKTSKGFVSFIQFPSLFNMYHQQMYSLKHLTFPDRKSTRLNSSHVSISYAVICLKKKI